MRHPRFGPRSAAIPIALLALGALAPTAGAATHWRKAPGFPTPPVRGDCLVLSSPSGCMYDVRLTDFTLSSHIVHVGGHLSGSGSSQWKEQTPALDGAGLHLLRKHIVPATSFTATWKAVADTNFTWSTSLGLTISVPGSAVYTEGDYYGVVDRSAAVLDGHVLDLDHRGVGDLDVLIEGIGSTDGNYIATTGGDGFYSAILDPGRYRVCVRQIDLRGHRLRKVCTSAGTADPAQRAVTVRRRRTATQNFAIQRSAHLKLTLTPGTVVGDGQHPVAMKVETLDRWGNPLAGQAVTVSPNVVGTPAQDFAIPALVCDAQGAEWPKRGGTGDDSSADPYNVTTDAHGVYEATVFAGSVGGSWKISARNTTTDTPRGFDEATLTIQGQSAVPYATLQTYVRDGLAAGRLPTLASSSSVSDLITWLVALRTQPFWQGVEFVPVSESGGDGGALLYPQGSPPTIDPVTKAITGDLSQDRVILVSWGSSAHDAQENIAMGGPPEAFSLGWAASDWVNGTTPGTALTAPSNVSANRNYTINGLRFGGFPYPQGAVTSTCG
jgi:hypothetical protein